jgi:hypothetical protein
MSFLSSIKTVIAGFLGWLGIYITHPNGWWYIKISEGTIAYYAIQIAIFGIIYFSCYKIYYWIVKSIKNFQKENHDKIISRGKKNK